VDESWLTVERVMECGDWLSKTKNSMSFLTSFALTHILNNRPTSAQSMTNRKKWRFGLPANKEVFKI